MDHEPHGESDKNKYPVLREMFILVTFKRSQISLKCMQRHLTKAKNFNWDSSGKSELRVATVS